VCFAKLGRMGRLGNQLFQIASTIGIARANGMSPVFPEWRHDDAFRLRLPRALPKDENLPTFFEQSFGYTRIELDSSRNLEGYFQSDQYFCAYKAEVLSRFELRSRCKLEVSRLFRDYGYPDCSIHVRRGDYVRRPVFYDLSASSYYEDACALLPSQTTFLCFSDDPEWCRRRFPYRNFRFAERSNDLLDMFVFSCCPVNIIANSTYSWWGAWLNMNRDSMVVAPDRWFTSGFDDRTRPFRASSDGYRGYHDTTTLLPAHWKKLNCSGGRIPQSFRA